MLTGVSTKPLLFQEFTACQQSFWGKKFKELGQKMAAESAMDSYAQMMDTVQ